MVFLTAQGLRIPGTCAVACVTHLGSIRTRWRTLQEIRRDMTEAESRIAAGDPSP